MKRALSLAVLGGLVVLLACTNMRGANDVPRISKEELKSKLGSPDMVLLDVRAKKDLGRERREDYGRRTDGPTDR